MGNLFQLKDQLLVDQRISDNEVEAIRAFVNENGKLDLDDVKFLVSLLTEAREVTEGFDAFFFPVLKQVILEDGCIGLDEQFYLLKMLYADGRIRDSERRFLRELKSAVKQTTPEFDSMYETAMATEAEGWCVGGRAR